MIRLLLVFGLCCILLAPACPLEAKGFPSTLRFQEAGQKKETEKAQENEKTQEPEKAPEVKLIPRGDKEKSGFTAEQIVESVIFVYGSRAVLEQIRRKGLEKGRVVRFAPDGKTEEATYERRFIRGENPEKDKIRVDQKIAAVEYSLVFGEGRIWGIINGAAFTPREEATSTFLSQHRHSIDSLLRYKESGASIEVVGREKHKGIDLYVLDLTDKDKVSTRYYISVKSLHILWLEYQAPSSSGGSTVKYQRKFFEYRYAQNTLLPFRNVLIEDGKETQETRILTVTFGLKIDDELFKNPQV